MNCAENIELAQKAKEIRKLTLTSIAKVGKGHIGGALSLCEVMSVLYFKHMNVRPDDPLWDDRDRFVLSKGHAGPVVYAALVLRGFLDPSELETMNHFGSMLPSHSQWCHLFFKRNYYCGSECIVTGNSIRKSGSCYANSHSITETDKETFSNTEAGRRTDLQRRNLYRNR